MTQAIISCMACNNVTLFILGAFKMRNCAICIVSVGLTHFPCNISLSFIHRVGILPTYDLGSNHRPAICKAEKYHSTPTNSAKGMDFKLYVSKGRQLVFQQCNVSTLAVILTWVCNGHRIAENMAKCDQEHLRTWVYGLQKQQIQQ
jgi:hypothetical protein